MPKIRYSDQRLYGSSIKLIAQVGAIIDEYSAQGYDLTLRQIYYQLVARGLIRNKDSEYKRLVSVITAGRRAGLIDWTHIVDRTRYLRTHPSWSSPRAIVEACAEQYSTDLWARQPKRPEIWVEKDALVGVVATACEEHRVPYLSCRGYLSDPEAWQAAQRFRRYAESGQDPIVIHLADHDASGVDMTRDLTERLRTYTDWPGGVEVIRIALNHAQVLEHQLPPNPAKESDSRMPAYRLGFGDESWELDAMQPAVIVALIRETIGGLIDHLRWEADVRARDRGRAKLRAAAQKL
jgi:hypothetical protein